jgi:Leucine-rich repeat (LRR) protein
MASGANVGSIVGYHSDYDGSNATIQNAYAFGAVQAQSYFGGIAGYNDGRIQNAYAFHDKFLHNDNMMKTVNFGKIATALGASGVTESVYSTPVTVPPTGYAFGEDASLNGQPMDGTLLLAAKTGIEGILGDSTVKNDIGAILDAQATWATYATPGFTGEDSAGSVTQNLTLPSVGVGTASLFWYTTRPDLVASDGTINRPKGGANVSVRLTATVTGAVYSGGSFSYSRLSDVTVWKAPPAVRRAVMFPGHDEIVIDFEQPYVSVDASKIEVSVDGSPIAATPAYTGNRMTLQLAIEPSTDATVEVTLLEGAVTDSNGEVNALDTRAVEPLVVVSFDDPDLESAIREQLGIPSPNPILSTDMETLYSLYAQYRGISDLTGLEYAVNLEQLDLSGNTGIADFAPLQALTSLNELNFGDAGLTDIDWIPSLSSLRTLYIWDNEIENITPLLTLYNNGGLQSGYRVIDVKGNPLQIVNEESPNMIVVRKLQSYEIEVRFDREYEEQFVLKQRKGVVGPEEFVEIIVSKTTLGHDVSSFDFILSMNPYVWTPVGYAPADGASGILELGWEEEEEGGIRIAGTFVEGQEPEGATDLVKLYLKSSAMSESPYIAAAAFGEGGEEELPPIPIPPYWAFGIRDAYTVDSLGVERYTVPALVGFVPPSSPDVDRNGIVNAVDVELVSAVFGKTDEDFESTDEFDSLDMNWNGVIDMDDITFVYMRSKVPGFDPDAPGDDMIPFDIDWELPE